MFQIRSIAAAGYGSWPTSIALTAERTMAIRSLSSGDSRYAGA